MKHEFSPEMGSGKVYDSKVMTLELEPLVALTVGHSTRTIEEFIHLLHAHAVTRLVAVIHNAAVGYREPKRLETEDGLPHVFAINTLVPYILTALLKRPKRLVYLSSGLHRSGDSTLQDLAWERRHWNGPQTYSDTKLHDVLLAFAVARLWPDVLSNALEPGWVATKMGGPGAPDDLDQAHRTQVWLAVSDETAATVTGEYFYHRKLRSPHPATRDPERQEKLLKFCAERSGVKLV